MTSVIQMTHVSQSLHAMNQVALPLGKQLLQLEADTEVLRREAERRMGRMHWDAHRGTPKSFPVWLMDVLRSDIDRITEAVSADTPWADRGTQESWRVWSAKLNAQFGKMIQQNEALKKESVSSEVSSNEKVWSELSASLEAWYPLVRWGATEQERLARRSLGEAQASVSQLRTALEGVLAVVLALSLLIVWLGERALRPLAELTRIARDITVRGLRQDDKAQIGFLTEIARDDEVSTLAREFHRMATALLERSRMVEQQTERLAVQNRLLEEMGELNASILRSIHQILIVFDSQGRIQLANPAAQQFLLAHEGQEGASKQWKGYSLSPSGALAKVISPSLPGAETAPQVSVLSALKIEQRSYSGAWVPLWSANRTFEGQILILEETTEKLEIESRLKSAEHLAAIGRMSAQVAHEIRNPLHSIGLEAELALDVVQKRELFKETAWSSQTSLSSSLGSILKSVDRLEKITGNYLKLSKLSSGKKERVDLVILLEEVLAAYAPVCEAQGVLVNWAAEDRASEMGRVDYPVWVDRSLMENAIGNLFKNALQALEGIQRPRIELRVSRSVRGWINLIIEDNGPGISSEVMGRLFTPFVTSKAQGTGLGLSFSKQVLEEQGGELKCRSNSSSGLGGACFELQLPLAPPAPPESITPENHSSNLPQPQGPLL